MVSRNRQSWYSKEARPKRGRILGPTPRAPTSSRILLSRPPCTVHDLAPDRSKLLLIEASSAERIPEKKPRIEKTFQLLPANVDLSKDEYILLPTVPRGEARTLPHSSGTNIAAWDMRICTSYNFGSKRVLLAARLGLGGLVQNTSPLYGKASLECHDLYVDILGIKSILLATNLYLSIKGHVLSAGPVGGLSSFDVIAIERGSQLLS